LSRGLDLIKKNDVEIGVNCPSCPTLENKSGTAITQYWLGYPTRPLCPCIISSIDILIDDLYYRLHVESWRTIFNRDDNEDYEIFNSADYVDNPVALARIQAGITQKELANLMEVTQAYISKIENQEKVTVKMLNKVKQALSNCHD
jgi:DNA-binding XRE family transcriptional regulator